MRQPCFVARKLWSKDRPVKQCNVLNTTKTCLFLWNISLCMFWTLYIFWLCINSDATTALFSSNGMLALCFTSLTQYSHLTTINSCKLFLDMFGFLLKFRIAQFHDVTDDDWKVLLYAPCLLLDSNATFQRRLVGCLGVAPKKGSISL